LRLTFTIKALAQTQRSKTCETACYAAKLRPAGRA
jgi:hypothetical protein